MVELGGEIVFEVMIDLFRSLTSDLLAARDMSVAMDVLADALGVLGFPRAAYAYLPVPRLHDGRWLPPPVTVRNYPRGWNRHWDRHCPNDPYYHACFESTLSVDWKAVQQRERLSSPETASLQYLADNGIDQGVTMPLHLPGGRFAYVSAVGDGNIKDWDEIVGRSREALFLVAHQFHDIVSRRFGDAAHMARLVNLTPRELECLQWAARGKTACDIAAILDRSVETVKLHLKHATSKLGAVNRAHAVAKAAAFGLIDPSL